MGDLVLDMDKTTGLLTGNMGILMGKWPQWVNGLKQHSALCHHQDTLFVDHNTFESNLGR